MENFDIVFITPPLSQKERYGVKFTAGGQTPSTGIALLAAICRRAGYKVALIDAPALGMDVRAVADKILTMAPKYVGITAVTISVYNAKDVALAIKARAPGVKIILGGAHITAVPDETFKRMGAFFDIAVIGEGDVTIIELLDAFENKKSLDKVNGIAYPDMAGGKLIFTSPREMLIDLDSLPLPAWDLLPDLGKYYTPPAHAVTRFPAALLVTSRGCPNSCTFCDNKVFGKKIRSYSADYVVEMIKHLQKNYGIREVQFRDDNFLVFKEMVAKFCNRLIEEKIDIAWNCTARVDIITPEYLSLLKKAGCQQIWYGIESGTDRVLKVIRKNTTVEMIKRAVILTKQAGISPGGFFIIGLPTETEEEIKATIKLLLELPLDEFNLSHLTPFPGSEISATATQYGSFDDDWRKLNGWCTVFVAHGLSHKKLAYYSNLAHRKFYFRPRIIFNYIKKIKSLHALRVYFVAFLALLTWISQKERR